MAWDVEALIASVKRRAVVPTAQQTFQTADFLNILNEEMQSYLVPFITSQREEYFVAHYDVALQNNLLEYRFPTRAVGQALRDVWIINAQSQLVSFPRISRGDLEGASRGFYLDGNVLELVIDNPANVGQLGPTLRMTYHQRPNALVASTAVGTITSISSGTKQVTVGVAPGTFTGSVLYDFVRGRPGFEWLGVDQSASVAGTVLTFANALPSELVVGDVVALAGETNYPQIPPEIHPLLAQRAAVRCLEEMGDTERVQGSVAILGRMETDAAKLLAPRVAGKVERIVNRSSLFRQFF